MPLTVHDPYLLKYVSQTGVARLVFLKNDWYPEVGFSIDYSAKRDSAGLWDPE